MKSYNKLFAILAVGSFMASCADQDVDNYYVEAPENITAAEYLLKYDNIKSYVDRAAYPNFKIACALGADDYNKKGIVYRVANQNFDEITLGNAMKYASVVGDDGSMNFLTISDLLDNAEAAGMSVYGHTLAWHAQQNMTWLNTLLAPVEITLTPDDLIVDTDVNFADYSEFPFEVVNSFVPTIADGMLSATIKNKKNKFYITETFETEVGKEYEFTVFMRCDQTVNLPFVFGDNNIVKVNTGAAGEWTNVKFKATAVSETSYLMVDPGNLKVTIDVSTVVVGHMPPNTRPLSDEEKLERLNGDMERWITGMMTACDGRVKAWDLINEAISGDGDVNGYYDLQHANGSSTDFFWQDYFGSENYGPIVEGYARKAYAEAGGNPADLKLFVNDYNLESDWDNNKKLKSLIYWVGVWEKGGAKIDGLSSQMHISYYEDRATMKSKADHMVNMLHLMANTGKLVRISELDMGYVDINGNDIATADMTPEQLQNMANYYQFIIQMFLKIVPKEQQYSICQWCLTDAPAKSGWRANTPVGLWTEDWNRKPAYAAFCDAFKLSLPGTEDFFEYLTANNLTHYITVDE